MLSIQLNKNINSILNALNSSQYLFNALEILGSTNDELKEYIIEIAQNGQNMPHLPNHINSSLSQVREKLGEIKPRRFFASIEKLQIKILEVKEFDNYDEELIDQIDLKLNDFSHAYEAFIESYSTESSARLVLEAHALHSLLMGIRKGLYFYLNNIQDNISELDNKTEFSIILPSTMNLTEFIKKLKAIEEIYKELSHLLNTSLAESPIEIIKIESGSFWAKLLGDNKVIELMTSLIESGVLYIYRNYTEEGKLVSIPKKVKSIESVLNLSASLKEQGVDVEEINELLQKSSITIAKDLNILISGEPQVTINDKTLSIGHELQKKLIKNNVTLGLEKSAENNTTPRLGKDNE